MVLRQLINGVEHRLLGGSPDAEIGALQYDSRRVRPGDLFVCIRGFHQDGHTFLPAAWRAGATAALVEREDLPPDLLRQGTVVWVPDTRRALASLACRYYRDPSRDLTLIGVTGTNGKTTTTYLVDSILRAAGHRTGLIGTIVYRADDETIEATRTTPESLDLQALLDRMRNKEIRHAVMEVSSHSLALSRVEGCEFDIAVFTNLTQDHLDFHRTMEEYREAKLLLFRMKGRSPVKPTPPAAVINRDDPSADAFIAASAGRRVYTYSVEKPADLTILRSSADLTGIRCAVESRWGRLEWESSLLGRYNLGNLMAAAAAGLHLGARPEEVARGIAALPAVPGRFEPVKAGQDFGVVVDYAHTPDALEHLLRTAREMCAGRLILLFGAGGDRDRGKRPLMGEGAGRLADVIVLTSDNPRSEDPEQIMNAIEVGLRKTCSRPEAYVKISDRRAAIAAALTLARPGDLVLLAGKGHETTQVMADRVIPFDDRVVAREILEGRTHAPGG